MQGLKYLQRRKKQLRKKLKKVEKIIRKRRQKGCNHDFQMEPVWEDGELINKLPKVCTKCGLEEPGGGA